MIIQCEQCNVKYRLNESAFSGERTKVRCAKCQHIFIVSKENPSSREPHIPLSIDEPPKESTQDSLKCPNCGFQQPPSQDCIKCGIVFSKFKERADDLSHPYLKRYGLDKGFPNDQVEKIHMTYAGFWHRFAASFIDGIVVGIIALIILMVTVGPTWLLMLPYLSQNHMTGNPQLEAIPASFPLALFMGVSLSVVLPVLYFIIMWGRKGATLGKMAMGIRIVRTDGSDISYGTAFLRYIGYQVVSPALFFLGYLWMLWDDREQTWHDKIASTCVVRTQ